MSLAAMASTDGTSVLAEINSRLRTHETGMSGASTVASRVAHIETQIAGNSSALNNVAAKIKEMEAQTAGIIDAKIAAPVAVMTASGEMQANQQHANWSSRSILESKAVQDI